MPLSIISQSLAPNKKWVYTQENHLHSNPPLNPLPFSDAHNLQEQSSERTSSESAANLDARSRTSELARRRRVRSSARRRSSAGGLSSTSASRGSSRVAGSSGGAGHDDGGVRRRAGDGVGGRCRGGVVGQEAVQC
jgi:hypothetical protein